jgi:hypothetical protein
MSEYMGASWKSHADTKKIIQNLDARTILKEVDLKEEESEGCRLRK